MNEAQSPVASAGFLLSKTHLRKGFLAALLSAAVFFVGCEKDRSRKLSAAEIHAITQELAAAAAARGAVVRIRKSASDNAPNSRDAVRISLRIGSSGEAGPARTALLQSLDRVMTRHRLARDAATVSGESTSMLLRRAGNITHEIEIETWQAASTAGMARGDGPRLAIILDDLGGDRAAADAIFALHCPLTLSVLPGHAHTAEIAEEAHRRGLEVMLHLPMESVGKERAEAQELRPGMPPAQVASLVDGFLAEVPYAAGINNHQGSGATSDPALMSELMPLLRHKQLFYIDSRTTAATVAYDEAQKNGVRSAFRNVPFLDDVEEVTAVRKQLALAFQGAREKGEAIAIGHPHPATLQALRELLPKAKDERVKLVVASDLVH